MVALREVLLRNNETEGNTFVMAHGHVGRRCYIIPADAHNKCVANSGVA